DPNACGPPIGFSDQRAYARRRTSFQAWCRIRLPMSATKRGSRGVALGDRCELAAQKSGNRCPRPEHKRVSEFVQPVGLLVPRHPFTRLRNRARAAEMHAECAPKPRRKTMRPTMMGL